MILVGVTITSTPTSHSSRGISSTICTSCTVVTTRTLEASPPAPLKMAYSWSEYPVPLPSLPPFRDTATEPATNRSTFTSEGSARRPCLKAPRIVDAWRILLREMTFGSSMRNPFFSRGVAITKIFPSLKAISRTGLCGESGLQKTVSVAPYSGNPPNLLAAFSAPTKFGIRWKTGLGKRAIPSSSIRRQTLIRISSLSKAATSLM